MLRFRLKELIAEKEFREGRVITMLEIANATGIHRMTLSKLSNHRGYNPSADILDRLCTFFRCRIEQLVEHIPDDTIAESSPQKSQRKPQQT
jgi:putative transcriptional regulator